MIQTMLDAAMKMVDARGSAAALREHLAMVATHVKHLEAQNAMLQANFEKMELQAAQLADQLRRFTEHNPKGHRCSGCGSVDLVHIGTKNDADFGELVKHPVMRCRACQETGVYTDR